MKKKNLLMTTIAIFGLATITVAQIPSYVPSNGLLGWWPFDGDANDESGNGNHGTVNGATLTTDRFGVENSAYSFNGSTNFIEISNSAVAAFGNQSFSCLAWFKSNATAAFNNSGTFVRYDNCVTNSGWGLGFGDYKVLGVEFPSTRVPNNVVSNSTYNTNQWILAIFVRDVTTMKDLLYIDGVLTAQTQFSEINQLSNTGSSFRFGSCAGFQFYLGILDDIGIWNRALSQQEITELYSGCQLAVSSQPLSQTVNINNNAQLSVTSSDPNATFQWQSDLGIGFQNLNNVGQYSGATNHTLTVSNATMSNNNQPFRCIISSGSCADTSDIAVLTVNNNVGINEISQDNLFSVFPNPTQSSINIKADIKLMGEVYTIYDNIGRVVLTGKLNTPNTTIELSNLSGGAYVFRIGENMKQVFSIIKE